MICTLVVTWLPGNGPGLREVPERIVAEGLRPRCAAVRAREPRQIVIDVIARLRVAGVERIGYCESLQSCICVPGEIADLGGAVQRVFELRHPEGIGVISKRIGIA